MRLLVDILKTTVQHRRGQNVFYAPGAEYRVTGIIEEILRGVSLTTNTIISLVILLMEKERLVLQ